MDFNHTCLISVIGQGLSYFSQQRCLSRVVRNNGAEDYCYDDEGRESFQVELQSVCTICQQRIMLLFMSLVCTASCIASDAKWN